MWLNSLFRQVLSCRAMPRRVISAGHRGRRVARFGGPLLVVALILTGANPVVGQDVPAVPGAMQLTPGTVRAEAPPNEINYQGYATDASGRPLNGTLTAAAGLWSQAAGGSLRWGPETHTNVPVKNGSFQIVLGDQISFSSGLFNDALYLELAINGTTLPRQKLRAVPYALTALGLVSGARIFSSGNQPELSLVIQNLSTEPQSVGLSVSSTARGIVADGSVGLTVSGTSGTAIEASDFVDAEGYRSTQDSYLYYSGANTLPYPNAGAAGVAMTLDEFGTAHLRGTGSLPGGRTVLLPLDLPGVLFGQNVTVKSLRLGYHLQDAEIRRVRLNEAYGTSAALRTNLMDSANTLYPNYPTFEIYDGGDFKNGVFSLNSDGGPLLLLLDIYFPNAASEAQIGDVRLQLGHEPLSP